MKRHIWPALSLFVLAPLIAEYLLGSLPVYMIAILPLMAMMYGSGALLIREVVRRTGRGWPSLLLLAAAYGLIEEGFVTQSLFNPNYLHLRLLDFGFMPALGTALPWLVFVVSLHIVWSISVPIGLTEALFKTQRDDPWLSRVGLWLFPILFVVGSALVATFSYKQVPFVATPLQFATTGLAVAVLIAAALLWPKRGVDTKGRAPHPVLLFLLAFLPGSEFQMMQHFAGKHWHWTWQMCVAGVAGLEGLVIAIMILFTRGRSWSDAQRFALMAGGLWVYIWIGFATDISLHGVGDLPGHAVIAALFIILSIVAGVRAMRKTS